MNDTPSVAARIRDVKAQIADAAEKAGRRETDIRLLAVSKFHPASAVEQAIAAGHRDFGENRVQEAAGKYPLLKDRFPDLRLHLIGPLQTNKVRDAVALFDVIETLDRPKLAGALARERDKTGQCPDLLVQINTGEEPQKAGISPVTADEFIRKTSGTMGLPVVGVMCIPPVEDDPAPHFALLAEVARRHDLEVISMGMSADFEEAIYQGSTEVRLGTAIFGSRPDR